MFTGIFYFFAKPNCSIAIVHYCSKKGSTTESQSWEDQAELIILWIIWVILIAIKLLLIQKLRNRMEKLPEFLNKNRYQKIKFRITKTQHLLIKGKINGVSGSFILDTGASNSCVGFEGIEFFKLKAKKSKTKASGAGATGMNTQISIKNELKLSRWQSSNFDLVIFDMSHVNEALRQYKVKPVNGIIGADILLKGKAIIDYYNSYLYLLK